VERGKGRGNEKRNGGKEQGYMLSVTLM
jgi:hypothetical protein